ncbi:MAG: hypothetical protein J5895_00720 [Alphaproteobacteria bacterium]|nr:hypothetical protein [Alphaproteobacteria bacterium]
MKAIADRVLLKLEEKPEQKHGILLPDNFQTVKTIGKVLSVGKNVTSVDIGDVVLFHAFDELPTLKKNIVAVRESSILAIMEDGENL